MSKLDNSPPEPGASYEVALGRIRSSEAYETLKGICSDPYLTRENYTQIIQFIRQGACKFWKYLLLREAGITDPDPVRAAAVLEYSRIIFQLVKDFPEFKEKIHALILKNFPAEFRKKKPLAPAQLVKRLQQLNELDYLDPESGPAPAKSKPGIKDEITPLFSGFSFLDPFNPDEEEESTEMWALENSSGDDLFPRDLRVYFRILRGPSSQQEIPVREAPIMIGRDPLSPIRLQSKKVSRQHAILSYQNHKFFLKDLGSTNGTYLNSQPVTDSIIINHEDIIQFGDVVCRFIAEHRPEEREKP